MNGVKHDESKPKMSLVSPLALREVAQVMTFGADKYGTYNYLGGMNHSRLLDAALRHINAHITGNTQDLESGLLHLSHAAASLLMLIEYIKTGVGVDDRWEGYKSNER